MKKLCILFCSALAALPLCGVSGQESALEDGDYWFVSPGKENHDFAIYAEPVANDSAQLKWKELSDLKDKSFLWHVTKVDGGYSVQNAGNSAYISKAKPRTDAYGTQVWCTTDFQTPTLFNSSAYPDAGLYVIIDATNSSQDAPAGFHMGGHGGESGDVLMYDYGGEGDFFTCWYALKASESVAGGGEPTYADSLRMLYAKIPQNWKEVYQLGANPGFVTDADKYTQFEEAYNKAKADAAGSAALGESEAQTLYGQLGPLWQWLRYESTLVPEGWYWFKTADEAFGSGSKMAIYAEGSKEAPAAALRWKEIDDDINPAFIWHVTHNSGGEGYQVQNAGTEGYIGSTGGNDAVQCTAAFETPTLLTPRNDDKTVWVISDEADGSNQYFNMAGHNGGSGTEGNIVTYSYIDDAASQWRIEEVPEAVLNAALGKQLTPQDSLALLYENIPSGWQDTYVLGADPGFVGDTAKYDRFAELYGKAADAATLGEEEASTTLAELSSLWQWLQSDESRTPVEEGYYWFANADPASSSTAIYADGGQLKWKEIEESDAAFIWHVTKVDGGFSVQNASTTAYIDSAGDVSSPVNTSDALNTPTVFNPCYGSHAGIWVISDTVDYEVTVYGPTVFHEGGHGTGSGDVVIYYCGNANDLYSAWYVRKVPDYIVNTVVPGQQATAKDSLQLLLEEIPADWENDYVLGTDPGFVDEANTADYERIEELRGQAAANIGTLSEEQCQTIYSELNKLWQWLQSEESLVPVEDGDYRFVSAADPSSINGGDTGGQEFAIFAQAGEGASTLRWAALNETDSAYVWTVAKSGDGYSVKNLKTGEYIDKLDGSAVKCSAEFQTPTVFLRSYDSRAGIWLISDNVDHTGNQGFHMLDHSYGLEGDITIYGNENPSDNSAWYLRKVKADDPVVSVGRVEGGDAGQAAVDVYTADGVLVRRGVPRAAAADGLAKGVYVIGKRKVLVK